MHLKQNSPNASSDATMGGALTQTALTALTDRERTLPRAYDLLQHILMTTHILMATRS